MITARRVLAGLAGVLVLGGVAMAAVPTGLQNAGFESGLAGWTVKTNGNTADASGATLITGSEQFTVAGWDPESSTVRDDIYTVTPPHGSRMVRLGEITNTKRELPTKRTVLSQTFVVDPAHPVLSIRYKIFSWEPIELPVGAGTPDPTQFFVTLTDANGAVLSGNSVWAKSDGRLNQTGWNTRTIDLTSRANQQVHLQIAAGDTNVRRGTWAYIDGLPADSTAPNTAITDGPPPLSRQATQNFTFTTSPIESSATFQCRVDSTDEEDFGPCSGAGTHQTALGHGLHTFDVRAVDGYGNADASPATRSFTVDTVAPVPVIVNGPPALSKSTTQQFSLGTNPAESSVTFQCRLDSSSPAAFAPCSGASSHQTNAGNGSHALDVRATDAAGNVSGHVSRQFRVDTVAPGAPTISGPATIQLARGKTSARVTLAITAEAGAALTCTVDGRAVACARSFVTPALTAGAHTITARARDAAGNTGAAGSKTITVKKPKPRKRKRGK